MNVHYWEVDLSRPVHLHDTCFVNVLDSFIPVIILKTYKFKSSVSFGTHTLQGH